MRNTKDQLKQLIRFEGKCTNISDNVLECHICPVIVECNENRGIDTARILKAAQTKLDKILVEEHIKEMLKND